MGKDDTIRELARIAARVERSEGIDAVKAFLRSAEVSSLSPPLPLEEQVQNLRSALATFLTHHEFHVSQVVRWKKGMRNRKRPRENEPAIVISVLPEPVFDISVKDSSAATRYFREPLDIVLGVLDSDGELMTFHFDSRRFEPFPEQDESVSIGHSTPAISDSSRTT